VHLGRPVTLAYDSTVSRSPAISVSGAGRFVGIMLARVGTTASSGQWFAQTRITACGTPNCNPEAPGQPATLAGVQIASETGFPETAGQSTFDRLIFPPGDYQLTLIAYSAPVTVTVKLQGLAGSVTLTPRPAEPVSTQSVTPNLLPTPAAPTELSVGGQSSILSHLGVLAFAISYRFTVQTGDLSNWCLYSGGQVPPEGLYLPGCPGDTRVVSPPSFIIIQQAVNIPAAAFGIVFVRGDQLWHQGYWSAGANLIASSHPASFLWLSVPT